MRLPPEYFRPFDRIYAAVTADIEAHARSLVPPDQQWLSRLIVTFNKERHVWNDRHELTGYRARWGRLETNLLRLAAGAYLHVAYDLPRAIADDWPGSGNWVNGPDDYRGESIFLALSPTFPRNFHLAARSLSMFGWPSAATRWLPPRFFSDYADAPMDRLRLAAWSHARVLATKPTLRSIIEKRMADALTAGLEDASDWKPWRIARWLRPPREAVFEARVVLPAVVMAAMPPLATGLVAGLTAGVVIWLLLQFRAREEAARGIQADFIHDWGHLLGDYMDVAVRDPEGFDRYRRDRRIAMGLEPSGRPPG